MNEKSSTLPNISPAILEQKALDLERRIRNLEFDLENEKLDHEKTKFERDCYKQRLEGFERMSHSLAVHVDKICRDFDFATGGIYKTGDRRKTKEEIVALADAAVEFTPVGEYIDFDGIVVDDNCGICGKPGTPGDHGGNCEEKDQVLRDFAEERA